MPMSLDSLPRPAALALAGCAAALAAALTIGELVWWAARPAPAAPAAEPHTAPPGPDVRLAVTAPAGVSVYPGGKSTFAVRLARARFEGPVLVRVAAPTPDLAAAEVTIPADESRATVPVVAAPTAKPGTYPLAVTVVGANGDKEFTAGTTVEVTVVARPPPPPGLSIAVSPRLQAYPGGQNTFAVRIARRGFDGPVTVTFNGAPTGVTLPSLTVPAGVTEATGRLAVLAGTVGTAVKVRVAAGAEHNGAAVAAETEVPLDVLPLIRAPVDVVFAFDSTGSMKKTAETLAASAERFAEVLGKKADVRFGLVSFQDTTLGQPLRVPRLDGDGVTDNPATFRAAVRDQRFGGGGGEGESSLDGIAEAADHPFRAGGVRVVVLVTDGGPKRVDGRIKSADELVKHLKARKIDQLHVVALAEHRKAFEPLWDGAKGRYFELKVGEESYDPLLTELGTTVIANLPAPAPGKVAPGAAPGAPEVPPVATEPPPLPAGAEADEPKIEAPAPEPEPAPAGAAEEPKGEGLAVAAWAVAVVLFACGLLVCGQLTFLPGGPPLAVGYVAGAGAGVLAGAAGYFAFGAVGVPILARLGGALTFGGALGALVAVVERRFRTPELLELPEDRDRSQSPAELPQQVPDPDDEPPAAKPNISAPKPRDGCPGCGRVIPGEPGERYCMLCDNSY